MSTELETAHGTPRVFTKTSTDVVGVVGTDSDFFTVIDVMDIQLPARGLPPKSFLLTISYCGEIEIKAPAQNNNVFQGLFILCTLDPTNTSLDIGGVNCHPSHPAGPGGLTQGVPFGNNFGLNAATSYHGVHSFTWVQRVNAGPHKLVMRACRRADSEPPGTVQGPRILKRTLVVQAVRI